MDTVNETKSTVQGLLHKYVNFKVEVNFLDKWEKEGRFGFVFGFKDSKGWPIVKLGYTFEPKTGTFYAFKDCKRYCSQIKSEDASYICQYLESL